MIAPGEYIDSQTGMPLDDTALGQEKESLAALLKLAQQCVRLKRDAERISKLSVECDYPDTVANTTRDALDSLDAVQQYASVVGQCREDIAGGDWKAAADHLCDYLADPALADDHAGFKLLKFVNEGARADDLRNANLGVKERYRRLLELESSLSHPLLESHLSYFRGLERVAVGETFQPLIRLINASRTLAAIANDSAGLSNTGYLFALAALNDYDGSDQILHEVERCERRLTAEKHSQEEQKNAEFVDSWTHRLRQAAGDNETALLAMSGEVEAVFERTLHTKPVSPADVFNLAVAVCARSRFQEERDEQSLQVAMGVGAVVALSSKFRQAVCRGLRTSKAEILTSDDPHIRQQVEMQVRDALFDNDRFPWGAKNDPNSWACRWDGECYAVIQMGASGGELEFPYGPTLVQFFGLDKLLAKAFANTPMLRRWFGPCAVGESLRWIREFPRAVQHLSTLCEYDDDRAAQHPGYAYLDSPGETLRRDACTARSQTQIRMLRDARLGTGMQPDEAARVTDEICQLTKDVLQDVTRVEDPAEVARSLLRTLGDVYGDAEERLDQSTSEAVPESTTLDARLRLNSLEQLLRVINEVLAEWKSRTPDNSASPVLTNQIESGVSYLRKTRSRLLVTYVYLQSDRWHRASQSGLKDSRELVSMLDDMEELLEQAIAEDPRASRTHLARIEVRMLRAAFIGNLVARSAEFENELSELQRRSVELNWPVNADTRLSKLKRLLGFGRGLDQMRQLLQLD